MTAERDTSADFIAFLDRGVVTQPNSRELHLILDNFSAHKTKAVRAWLEEHPRASARHSDLQLVVESGAAVVRENLARVYCARYLHLHGRPSPQADGNTFEPTTNTITPLSGVIQIRNAASVSVLIELRFTT